MYRLFVCYSGILGKPILVCMCSMRGVIYIIVLLVLLLSACNHWSDASNKGAPFTSCYTYVINHDRFGFPEVVRDCDALDNDNCRIMQLSVRCENETHPYCCDGLNVASRFLYTMCSYRCKFYREFLYGWGVLFSDAVSCPMGCPIKKKFF